MYIIVFLVLELYEYNIIPTRRTLIFSTSIFNIFSVAD